LLAFDYSVGYFKVSVFACLLYVVGGDVVDTVVDGGGVGGGC
jgi:hypothetical protein